MFYVADNVSRASFRVWWFGYAYNKGMWEVVFPLWVLLIALFSLAVTAWHLDALARRRARLNLCPKCNYDRTGLRAEAICPECGS